MSKEEIERMKVEAEANAEADNLEREMVDKVNGADSLIFQTEKQIKEFSDKLTEEDKSSLTERLNELKSAHSDKNVERIDDASAKLNETWNDISTRLYQQSSEESTTGEAESKNGNDEVEDADFEEVK